MRSRWKIRVDRGHPLRRGKLKRHRWETESERAVFALLNLVTQRTHNAIFPGIAGRIRVHNVRQMACVPTTCPQIRSSKPD